jgi:peroxiredoxin
MKRKRCLAAVSDSWTYSRYGSKRMMTRSLIPLTLLGLIVANCSAADANPILNIGDAAPSWTELPGVDGKKHSLSDLKDKDVVVVAFTCNSCPYAVEYEDRMIAFAKKFCGPDSKMGFVAINVNKVPEDSFQKMQERAKAKSFPYSYLYDETQKIARDFGANFTPEFFVLNKERRVEYKGGMDDNSNSELVTQNFLESAVVAVLNGTPPPVSKAPARGCRIRFARERGE